MISMTSSHDFDDEDGGGGGKDGKGKGRFPFLFLSCSGYATGTIFKTNNVKIMLLPMMPVMLIQHHQHHHFIIIVINNSIISISMYQFHPHVRDHPKPKRKDSCHVEAPALQGAWLPGAPVPPRVPDRRYLVGSSGRPKLSRSWFQLPLRTRLWTSECLRCSWY